MDKLADALQRLGEDDLLQIVQIVNDGKTDDMYVRNDLEGRNSFSFFSNCANDMTRGRISHRLAYTQRSIAHRHAALRRLCAALIRLGTSLHFQILFFLL